MGVTKTGEAPHNLGAETEESSGRSYTHIKKEIFLKAFREKGTIKHSYEAADVCRQTIYNWLADDEVFKSAFEDAKEDFADSLEEKLYDRLEKAGQNRANIELLAALKAHRREKWGDNLTVTPSVAGVTFYVVRIESMDDVRLESLDTQKQLEVGREGDNPAASEAERIIEES